MQKQKEAKTFKVDCHADSANRRIYNKLFANSKIVDEFLGFCEASDNDRTLSPSSEDFSNSRKDCARDELPC